jgi:hypothetical protein
MADSDMEKRGYKKVSASPPDQPVEADMANEDVSETWTGRLDPIQLSEKRPFWWRPHRGRDDLWMEIMSLREAQGARVI